MDSANTDLTKPYNAGLMARYKFIKNGKSFELEGNLFEDLLRLDSPILNGVPIRIRFTPSSDSFRLMSSNPASKFKVVLEKVK
jgi:hypothetical protein